jgi:hypothetical protein
MSYLDNFGPNVAEPHYESAEETAAWAELAAMHNAPRIDFTVPARMLLPDDRL